MFNTCNYEPEIQMGQDAFQATEIRRDSASIRAVERSCICEGGPGSRPNRRKNQVEGLCRVPKALCLEYAKLLIAHLKLMGKEEFLAYRMKALKAELPTGPKVTYPKGKPEGSKHSEAEQVSTESSSSARASSSTPRPMEWSEGYGKYGMLKPSLAADQDPAKEVYVGGLRGTLSVDGRIIQTLVIQ